MATVKCLLSCMLLFVGFLLYVTGWTGLIIWCPKWPVIVAFVVVTALLSGGFLLLLGPVD